MCLWGLMVNKFLCCSFARNSTADSSAAWKECNMERSYSLSEFARQNDIGLTTVRGEVKAGRLVARKVGRGTIFRAEGAGPWQEKLPKGQPGVRPSDGVRGGA